ncbi:hypothetical protein F5B20DRAFT_579802 [Whalleya microplaca]|nr:hypothetical protein F5B20DRAFT_579802 [Whalleya microplaca]
MWAEDGSANAAELGLCLKEPGVESKERVTGRQRKSLDARSPYTFTTTALLTSLVASAMGVVAKPLESKAEVHTFAGDNCDGKDDPTALTGSGSYRCIAVSGKRSIRAPEKKGCNIKTFSGSDCKGSSWKVPDGDVGCHSVLFASVEIQC